MHRPLYVQFLKTSVFTFPLLLILTQFIYFQVFFVLWIFMSFTSVNLVPNEVNRMLIHTLIVICLPNNSSR